MAPEDFRAQQHPNCIACDPLHPLGLNLRFAPDGDRGVTAAFDCAATWQGYPDRLHGGIVALLLDAAMTNCLFRVGVAGVTARMDVRYRAALQVGTAAVVRAELERAEPPLYVLKAEVEQDGQVRAAATGKFFSAC